MALLLSSSHAVQHHCVRTVHKHEIFYATMRLNYQFFHLFPLPPTETTTIILAEYSPNHNNNHTKH